MFKIISMREDGSSCQLVNEIPAFYALMKNGVCVGVFTTTEAANLAANELMMYEGSTDTTVVSVDLTTNQEDGCPHDEWDHDQCLDCGKERCPGEAIDRAMDYMEDR